MRAACVALAVVLSISAFAQEQTATTTTTAPPPKKPIVRWHGPLAREVAADEHCVTIPVDLEGALSAPQIRGVTSAGRVLDVSVAGANIVSGAQPGVTITLDPKKTSEARTYNVSVLLRPTNPQLEQTTLDVAITRVAAELDVLSPVRLERIDGVFFGDSWTYGKLAVTETGKSPAKFDAATSVIRAKDADNHEFDFSVKAVGDIKQGGTVWIEPEQANHLPLGLVTGKMSVKSKQLAAPVPITIEVLSRRSYGWLVLIIVIGVGIGWTVRKWLEGRRTVEAARGRALPLWNDLDAVSGKTREEEIARKVGAIRKELVRPWRRGTAAQIDAAATAAREKLTKLDAEIAEELKKAAARVSALRASIGDPEQQSGTLRTVARDVDRERQSLEAMVREGWFRRPVSRVDEIEKTLPGTTAKALAVWRNNVTNFAAAVAKWKDLSQVDLKPLDAMKSASMTDVAATMKSGGEVSNALNAIAHEAARTVADIAVNAIDEDRAKLQPAIAEVAATREKFYDDPAAMAAPLGRLFVAMKDALLRAAGNDEAKKKAIHEGRFTAAFAVPVSEAVDRTEAPAVIGPLSVRISHFDAPIAGKPLLFEAAVTHGSETVRDARLSWIVDGRRAQSGREGELTFTLVPSSEPIRVQAEMLNSAAPGDVATDARFSNVITLHPLPAELVDQEQIETREKWASHVQSAILALIIVAIGFAISTRPGSVTSWTGCRRSCGDSRPTSV